MFFKRSAKIICNRTTIDMNIKYLFSKKHLSIPYTKIHSVSATEDYLSLHLKTKNISSSLNNSNTCACIIYYTKHYMKRIVIHHFNYSSSIFIIF